MSKKLDYTVRAAIEIGSYRMRGAIAQISPKDEVTLLSLAEEASCGMHETEVTNIDSFTAALAKLLQKLEQRIDAKLGSVRVSFSSTQVVTARERAVITFSSRQNTVQPADLTRLREQLTTIEKTGMVLLHTLPMGYIVDSRRHVRDPLGMQATRLDGEYLLVYVPESILRNLQSAFQKLKLRVEGWCLSPWASAYAALTPEEKESGVALLDLGAHTMSLLVYLKGVIHTFEVHPFGVHLINRDIQKAFNLVDSETELIKHQAGSAFAGLVEEGEIIQLDESRSTRRRRVEIDRRVLAEIIQARQYELLGYATRSLWEKSDTISELHAGFVITGGGAEIHGLESLAELALGKTAVLGDTSFRLKGGLDKEGLRPSYAALIGTLILPPDPEFMYRPQVKASAGSSLLNKFTSLIQKALPPDEIID